ncbi:competence protein ComGF, partial [Lactobacillus sp. XV13L]|nr:competence protein ComGF [Lactobacillus sp. XV13L]
MIAEAVFAVFIALLVVLILQGLLKSLTTADKAGHRTDDVVFAYVQFNRFLKNDAAKAYVFPKASNSRQAAIIK